MKKAELLSPAGDFEKLRMAVAYGADAVYLAGTAYGMRGGTNNFTVEELPEAIRYCHERGVAVYVTCNTIPTDTEMQALPPYLELLDASGADGLIIADLGVMSLAKRHAPHCALHISTQAGVMSAETARVFHDLGASRVVLAREMSLDAVAALRSQLPAELEIEAFCHGAMCVSFSGRCVLSNYLTGRDSNRGQCAQPCRWKYHLMEEKRPGQYFEITEDGGTYILNSRDMCMIEHIPALLEAGVTSLKIEGRTKSAYYTASVTAAYRHALNAALAGREPDTVWLDEVNKTSHRPYSTGFYFGEPGQYSADALYCADYEPAALVERCEADGSALLTQRNRFSVGDELELLRPDGDPLVFPVGAMTDAEGAPVETARHPQMEIHTKLPVCVPPNSFLRQRRKAGGQP